MWRVLLLLMLATMLAGCDHSDAGGGGSGEGGGGGGGYAQASAPEQDAATSGVDRASDHAGPWPGDTDPAGPFVVP